MPKKKDKIGETTKTKSKKPVKKKTVPAAEAPIDGTASSIGSPVPPELRATGSANNNGPAPREISRDEVALRAYYIAERRRYLNASGDELGDWVEAERQLRKESPEKNP